jgi:AAA+ ATPase superfamily predicted ATPase
MDYAKFVDREQELKYLREILASKEFQLIPVWGRRRIGKTSLLLKALNGKGLYFLSNEVTDSQNLERFQEAAAAQLGDPTIRDLKPDWEIIFRKLADRNLPIVLDEFPYLVASNPAIPSIFQSIVDLHLKRTGTKLFLCGSSIRMMESSVLEYKAPLYGRRTGQIFLRSLKFVHLREFFPRYGFEDLVRVYGVCGGVPPYLESLDPKLSFWDNIRSKVLNKRFLFAYEVDFLLKQEFTSLGVYKSIIKAIADGRTQVNEIRDLLGAGKSDISPYLNKLTAIGLLQREVPVTELEKMSRKGIYRIADQFLAFHSRYIFQNWAMIEAGQTEGVLELVRKDYDTYLGRVFEKIAQDAFLDWSKSHNKVWEKVGRWWFKESEIDLVALSSSRNEMICAEVKWSARPLGPEILDKLVHKSHEIRWGKPDKKIKYMIISRGGFTPACVEKMRNEDVIHWDLKDLETWALKPFKGRRSH